MGKLGELRYAPIRLLVWAELSKDPKRAREADELNDLAAVYEAWSVAGTNTARRRIELLERVLFSWLNPRRPRAQGRPRKPTEEEVGYAAEMLASLNAPPSDSISAWLLRVMAARFKRYALERGALARAVADKRVIQSEEFAGWLRRGVANTPIGKDRIARIALTQRALYGRSDSDAQSLTIRQLVQRGAFRMTDHTLKKLIEYRYLKTPAMSGRLLHQALGVSENTESRYRKQAIAACYTEAFRPG